MRIASLLLFTGCASAAPPVELVDRGAMLCSERLRALGVDVERENAKALALAREIPPGVGFHALIVPGYTSPKAQEPQRALDPVAKERLFRAVLALQKHVAPFVIVSGGNVHPDGTPYNEAVQMKRYLRALGVPEDRILLEPCARHSYTNLRNAGRLMLSLGMSRGLIITSYDQAYYLGKPLSTTFRARTSARLGYWLGELKAVGGQDVAYSPSKDVFRRGPDAMDP